MEREDISKFTNSIILVSKLFTKIEDGFLKEKLFGKLSDFVGAFVEQRKGLSPVSHNPRFRNAESIAKSDDIVQHSSNVAQYRHQNLLNSINNLLDYLEYLAHISKSNTTPLFLAQRNLLKFKLQILRKSKAKIPTPILVDAPADIVRSNSKPKIARLALRSDSNKERIFNFIKKTPDVRTKDVLSEFNALSGRTVKRSLKELTEEGLLKKRSDGVAVYYLTNE